MKKNQIFARESDFLPVKKPSKTIKLPVKKKKLGVKNLKKRQKNAREKKKLPVKKWTKRPKMAFTGNFFFHGGKKKRCPINPKKIALT